MPEQYTPGRGPLKLEPSAAAPPAWLFPAPVKGSNPYLPDLNARSAPAATSRPAATPTLGDYLGAMFPTVAGNWTTNQAKAAEDYEKGNTAAALGHTTAAAIGVPVGAFWDAAVRPAGRVLSTIPPFLAAATGLGDGSGGPMPPSPAKPKLADAMKAPADIPPQSSAAAAHPASVLTGFLGDLLADPNVRKMSVRQITALAGLMPASMVRPVAAHDAAAYEGMKLDQQIYDNTLAAADAAEKAGNTARAAELRTSASKARLDNLKQFALVNVQNAAMAQKMTGQEEQ